MNKKNKNAVTAEEVMDRILSDPVKRERFQKKKSALAEMESLHKESSKPIVEKLNAIGLAGSTIHGIVVSNSPISSQAVDVFLKSLEKTSDEQVKESIVRALAATHIPFDGRPLVRCFEHTKDESLKWAVVNTLAATKSTHVDNFISFLMGNAYWRDQYLSLKSLKPGQET